MSSRPVYRMFVLRWRHLVNACEVKAHLIGCWQNLGADCFWQPVPSGLKPGCCCCPAWQSVCRVIAALRGRLLYVVYRVFVLTIIKRRLFSNSVTVSLKSYSFIHSRQSAHCRYVLCSTGPAADTCERSTYSLLTLSRTQSVSSHKKLQDVIQ